MEVREVGRFEHRWDRLTGPLAEGTEIEAALLEVFSGVDGRAEFDIVTTRSGIVLTPVDLGDPSEFVTIGVRLVPNQ